MGHIGGKFLAHVFQLPYPGHIVQHQQGTDPFAGFIDQGRALDIQNPDIFFLDLKNEIGLGLVNSGRLGGEPGKLMIANDFIKILALHLPVGTA